MAGAVPGGEVTRLRVLYFGTSALMSMACLRALAARHHIVAVVRTRRRAIAIHHASQLARSVGLLPADPLSGLARELRIPQWPVRSVSAEPFAARVAAARADVLCAVQFPWRLPDAVLGAAAHGGLNVHPSLLPRHRGVWPYFWVYHGGDRDTGITIHRMIREFDAGEVVAQARVPVPRGYPVDRLYVDLARAAEELVVPTLAALAAGTLERHPQDERLATQAPAIPAGRSMVDFATWDSERVWHFLAGLWPRFVEPVADTHGAIVSYGGVLGFERGPRVADVGRVADESQGRLALQCGDGVVYLAPAVKGSR